MRITLHLNDDLLAEARQCAARSGCNLTAIIEEALRESLGRRSAQSAGQPVHLPTWGKGWILGDVDLDDSAALLDLIER